jgi:transcriptional antiterminator RfaH
MSIESQATEPQNWFCLRSLAKREHVAAAHLRDRIGIDVFCPRIRAGQSRRGVLVHTTEALFPGYVFARFAYPHQIRHVLSTTGVTGIVRFGGEPPPVADTVIDYIRRQLQAARNLPVAPLLAEGAWVRILSGCFQYIEGRVLHFDPRTARVRLLLALLGSEVQVSLSAERVALVGDAQPRYPSSLMTTGAETLCSASA